MAASVANDDIVAMGRVYHPAAVLVTTAGTKPIAAALDGWGKDIVTAKKNGVRATVEFRFSSRRDDATTAFETGIFKVRDHRQGRRHDAELRDAGSAAGEARRQVARRHGTPARGDHRGGVERVTGGEVDRPRPAVVLYDISTRSNASSIVSITMPPSMARSGE